MAPSIPSWLVWEEIACMVHADLSKWPINQFKPVQQSGQKVLRTYYPNMYAVHKNVIKHHHKNDLCHYFLDEKRPKFVALIQVESCKKVLMKKVPFGNFFILHNTKLHSRSSVMLMRPSKELV